MVVGMHKGEGRCEHGAYAQGGEGNCHCEAAADTLAGMPLVWPCTAAL